MREVSDPERVPQAVPKRNGLADGVPGACGVDTFSESCWSDLNAMQNGATPAATGFMVFVGDDYRSPGLPSPTKK
ncbi:unnamed protein product [Phytophthora fragariaefolia]|uniref:Unnamed protein product n=1 Tax=Phytophthora fragariaefolia TaxID=1490495 RepID=A0A9W6TYQ0_9STRA|nr:unnamed protein product [Phytophthora fragariaefolia]